MRTDRPTEPRAALGVIVDFLRRIGFTVRIGSGDGEPGLPGIWVRDGRITADPDRLLAAGDLLHEAGHLAVMSPARRAIAGGRFASSQAEEMTAMAWSHAAAVHLGLESSVVFHELGYGDSGGGWLVDAFADGATIGVPGLCWLGLTSHQFGGGARPGSVYPVMAAWLNESENELL